LTGLVAPRLRRPRPRHAARSGHEAARRAIVEGTIELAIRECDLDLRFLPDAPAGRPRAGYVDIPITGAGGESYGWLRMAGHLGRRPDPRTGRLVALMVADQIERHELESERRQLAGQADAVRALLAALEARDSYSGDHSRAVADLALATAVALGLDDDEAREVEQVVLLHDIGKVAVPDDVLRKRGELTGTERELVETHPVVGASIVASIPSLAHLAPAVRAEHERWDGSGYPDGLAAEAIPIASRICYASDAYHAMTSDRPYRPRLSAEAARAELERAAGTQFDPGVVRAMLEVLAANPDWPHGA
jgi:HD-GYP domain-containing protein (c-di-GMP phosphodiesterase class II)